MSDTAASFIRRVDAVATRLREHVDRVYAVAALTSPDPPTGERWEAGQVWAHLAEFIPFWLREAGLLIAHRGEAQPVPFGRTKTDPGRLAAIERDRRAGRRQLGQRTLADVADLRRFLSGLDDDSWLARGVHPTLGAMDLQAVVEEFLVGHLEQHADQLDELAGQG